MEELKTIPSKSDDGVPGNYQVNSAFYELHSPSDKKMPEETAKNGIGVPDNNSPLSDTVIRSQKMKIIKNLLVVSFGFLLLFTAFQSLSNLQSSLNKDGGLGLASLSIIYGALVVSCMFVPTYMISWLGLKYTLITSVLLYGTYFVANFYARWYTLVPASILLGIGGAPLWTAKCAYLTDIAGQYASLTSSRTENMVVRFFGIFFMIFQSGQVWGNLITYYVLKKDISNSSEVYLNQCGAAFHPGNISITNNSNLERPVNAKVYVLCGIYTGCAFLSALFIYLLLDPLPRRSDAISSQKSVRLLVETFRHLKNGYQVLLVPLTIFSGLEQAYIIGDFTKAYVGCAWGIHNIGYVMICFGACDAVGSLSLGSLMKIIGRVPVFIFGAVVNVAMIITMLLWKPSQDEVAIFFVIAGLWGLGDAVWQTQINSVYGVLFSKNEEAAFANYRLWESLGFIIAFAYSEYLYTYIKLYILLSTLLFGIICYLGIEFHISFITRSSLKSDQTT